MDHIKLRTFGFNNIPIIDDSTTDREIFTNVEFQHTGYQGMRLPGVGYGQMYGAPMFPTNLVIPKNDRIAMLQEQERRNSTLLHLIKADNLPPLDQGQTNYCWINGPAMCCQILQIVQNQPRRRLSPASVGAHIKRFKNQGGWGQEGLEYIAKYGINTVQQWPANAIDRKYATEANAKLALENRVTEWWDVAPKNWDQLASLVIRRFPVAVGYNWWGHLVTAVCTTLLDGEECLIIYNSWGPSWGDGGFGILRGNRKIADDAVTPRVILAQAA